MISRKIYLYRKSRIEPVNIVQDSQVEISLEFADYTIPTGATVKAYARKAFGRGDTYVCECTASGSTVAFTPLEGFFAPGGNYLQIEVNGAIIPFTVDVICERRINEGDGSVAEPEKVKSLLAQAQEAAASAKESEQNASNNATLAGQAKNAAKSSAESAAGSASSAATSAQSAKSAQATTEEIAGNLESTVEAAEDATARAKSAAEAVAGLVTGLNVIIDDTTGAAFRLGIDNGIMYIEEE